jgi:dihydrofolate synthase/folylpolyglutamate synthase
VNFVEAETYLLSLGNEVSAMKLGLENIGKLLASLGNPQRNYLKVQVAGTNGKGSVCAFLDAICNAAGIRTGLTTSPHLVSITERVRINGQNISEDKFARFATCVRETSEQLVARVELETVPTYFEQVTAAALLAFAEAEVELAILETGLGGRLDATTAARAEVVAITRIDYDHQNILGATLTEIAAEKAAIIHAGAKVVIGEQRADAMDMILDVCQALDIKPVLADQVRTNHGGGWVNFTSERAKYSVQNLGLLGHHQIENAKVAILLAEALQEHFLIAKENIITGLESARHAGRLEFCGRYLFDGAHNIGGANALREFLDEFVDRPVTIIFGTMHDKDVSEIAEALFPKAELLIVTEPNNTRALEAKEIAKWVPASFDKNRVTITNSVAKALERATALSRPENVILITGSLYLVGEAKQILKQQRQI